MEMKRQGLSLLAGGLVWTLASAAPALAQHTSQPAHSGYGQEKTKSGQEAKSSTEKSGNAIKDSWITMKIHAQFVGKDALDDSDINVDTNNGVVTLTGTVASAEGRTQAAEIAKATDGVKSVNDKLRVVPATAKNERDTRGTATTATANATKPVSDGWIKSKISAQYVKDDTLDNSDINMSVRNGTVTLTGTVNSTEAKARAEQIAKSTDGVKTVRNSLKVSRNS